MQKNNSQAKRNYTIFSDFTQKYAISKTLCFELKPVGETLENMKKNLQYDENLKTFFLDQEIEDGYQILKPVFDKLHEKFISESLESQIISEITYEEYFEKYQKKSEVKYKEFEPIEKRLRSEFAKAYNETAEKWKLESNNTLKASGYKILTEKGILEYLKNNYEKSLGIPKNEKIDKALKQFERFFTYFEGFNQNRENYYTTDKEAATAVASRIVQENLPKFCDNILTFTSNAQIYTSIFQVLSDADVSLVTKEGKNLEPISESVFGIESYNTCLSQRQIETYNNKVGNANILINLYNQNKNDHKDFKKLPLFKTLYKQIGCGEKSALFFEIDGKNVKIEKVLEGFANTGEKFFKENGNQAEGMADVISLFEYIIGKENYEGVYWSSIAINTISAKYFANWSDLKEKLRDSKVFTKGTSVDGEKIKIPDAVELSNLFVVIDEIPDGKLTVFKSSILDDLEKKKIVDSSNSTSQALLRLILEDVKRECAVFFLKGGEVKQIEDYFKVESKVLIKEWLDSALSVLHILKYFKVKEKAVRGKLVDAVITEFVKKMLQVSITNEVDWFICYDAVRNYLTKKPQDDVKKNKLKLNFENGSLLGGGSDGQEKVKASVLLRNKNDYYLGILKKRNIFDTKNKKNDIYAKVDKDSGRLMLANLSFKTLTGKGFLGKFGIKYGILSKKNPELAIKNLKEIVRERYLEKYPLLEGIINSKTTDIKEFKSEVDVILNESYICEFKPINWSKLKEKVNNGELYLFQIFSKDFSEKSTGNKNLQTIYWHSVFQENSTVKLNGGGEIFFRKAGIEKKVKIGYEKKRDSDGKQYVVGLKRFTEEKFLFHSPINLNYKAKKCYTNAFNEEINGSFIQKSKPHFMGIDRGEKHLAYYAIVDQGGNLLEHKSFNVIGSTNYLEKLDEIEKNRMEARKNWQTIETIKNLKDGYISQVVHEIVNIATKSDDKFTYIVLEDLNTGFMRGRQKIEKSVYQKLELALAKKLNFLVDKEIPLGEIGSVTNAIQLTPPATTFQDIEKKKQFGNMLYIRADYTSQTDPVTGWRKKINIKSGKDSIVKQNIEKEFTDIGFDGKDYFFEYTDKVTQKVWKLYSGSEGKSLDRFVSARNSEGIWTKTKQDVKKILDELFNDFDKEKSLYKQIFKEGKEPKKINERSAWESLRFAIGLIQQIRNSGEVKVDDDFILSPTRDENGKHFDSRKATENQPNSGDANGAFNIARKGIVLSEHIKRGYGLYIRDEEWDAWLAGKDVWEKWIKDNQDKLVKK